MSRIDELIKKLCPDGVEFKELQEITHLKAGDRITKSMMNNGFDYEVYGGGTEPTGYYSQYNFKNAITIARAGSAGFVNWIDRKFWATDVCFVSSHKDNNNLIKFIYYFIKSKQSNLQKQLYGASMPKLNKQYLWKLKIPLPPLPVQQEIVAILDKFTKLEAELEARQKQYAYYRDALLSFNEIGEIQRKRALSSE